MIVTLRVRLVNEAGSLQEIGTDSGTNDLIFIVKENLLVSLSYDKTQTSMYLPKRELLSLRVVFALPNASMIGLLARIWRSISLMPSSSPPGSKRRRSVGVSLDELMTDAKYRRMYLAETVFPAPLCWSAASIDEWTHLSPLTTIV